MQGLALSFSLSNVPTPPHPKKWSSTFLNSLLDCGQNDHIFSKLQSSVHGLTHGLTLSKIFVIKMDLEKSKMKSLPNYILQNLTKTNHWIVLEVALSQKKRKREKANFIFGWSNLRLFSVRFLSYQMSNL